MSLKIQLFENQRIRTAWDEEKEEWYFSIVDVVSVLTESVDGRKYWNKLKQRLKAEGSELVTNCHQLKLPSADGKYYKTDVAKERLDEMQDPELTINRAMMEYKSLGYSDNWINQRLKSIEVRKELTDEWKRNGMQEGVQFAALTDIIYQTWAEKSAKEYKQFKGLKKENLRDNMTNTELILNMLAETATTDLSKERNPSGFAENAEVAKDGGNVARVARKQLESQLKRPVISPLNAKSALQVGDEREKNETSGESVD